MIYAKNLVKDIITHDPKQCYTSFALLEYICLEYIYNVEIISRKYGKCRECEIKTIYAERIFLNKNRIFVCKKSGRKYTTSAMSRIKLKSSACNCLPN